jgi:hypothetical protein
LSAGDPLDTPYLGPATTILHECTHILLDTDDEEIGGVVAYGRDLCGKLAERDPKRAINNADSLALFAAELYSYKKTNKLKKNA